MIRKVAVCFLLCAFSSASHAQVPDAKCKDSAYVSSQVEQIKSALARVVDAVEMVPPDEAEYIRSEARKALQQQNRVRFNAVAGRRFYSAFEFHEDAKVATQNIEAASRISGRGLARYLVVVLSRIGDLQERMREYTVADEKREHSTEAPFNVRLG